MSATTLLLLYGFALYGSFGESAQKVAVFGSVGAIVLGLVAVGLGILLLCLSPLFV